MSGLLVALPMNKHQSERFPTQGEIVVGDSLQRLILWVPFKIRVDFDRVVGFTFGPACGETLNDDIRASARVVELDPVR
jgi:hypothetical protein